MNDCMLVLFNLDCMICLWRLSSPMNIRVHSCERESAFLHSTVCRPKEDSDQWATPTTPIRRSGVWRAVFRPHVDCRMAWRERLECAWDQAPGESVAPPWSKCFPLWHRGVWVTLVYTMSHLCLRCLLYSLIWDRVVQNSSDVVCKGVSYVYLFSSLKVWRLFVEWMARQGCFGLWRTWRGWTALLSPWACRWGTRCSVQLWRVKK